MCNWEEIQKANEAIKTTPLERESKGKKTSDKCRRTNE